LSMLNYLNRPDYDMIARNFESAMRKRNINKDAPIEWNSDRVERSVVVHTSKAMSETKAVADHDHTTVDDPTNPRHPIQPYRKQLMNVAA
uniref:Transposase n=1 Tax=Anisakis simplex TaxID=6269 RepID=A0A0M3J7U2_ANISI